MKVKLTTGEELRIARRRAGLTQNQVGAYLGRRQSAIARWEASNTELPNEVWREAGLTKPINLKPFEKVVLLRKRLGLSIDTVRELLTRKNGRLVSRGPGTEPVSHVAIILIEHGEGSKADVAEYKSVLKLHSESSSKKERKEI